MCPEDRQFILLAGAQRVCGGQESVSASSGQAVKASLRRVDFILNVVGANEFFLMHFMFFLIN